MQLKTLFCLAVVCLAACEADAQSLLNTNKTRRSLSLDECIRMALEQSPRIKVLRFDPRIDRYQLAASYGVYDPMFSAQYTKSEVHWEGQFDTDDGTVNPDGISSKYDQVTTGLRGLLPTGLKYELGGAFTHTRGTDPGRVPPSPEFDDYVADAAIQLEQPLLRNFWTDAARTEIQVRKKEVQISEKVLEAEVRLVIRDVQTAYYERLFSLGEVNVQQKAYLVATNFVAQEREKLKVGKLAEIDLKRAESQAATILADLVLAEQRANAVDNLLKSLITDKYKDWLNVRIDPSERLVPVPERLDVSESWASALAERPELRQLELAGDILNLEKKRRHNQLFPDLNLIGGYGRSGLDSSTPAHQELVPDSNNIPVLVNFPAYNSRLGAALDDIAQNRNERWNLGAVFNIPLSRTLERNRYKAVKEQVDKNLALREQLHQTILVEVDNIIDLARSDHLRISLTLQARIYAEAAVEAEERRYAAGTGTSFQVLEAQRDLTAARSQEIRAQTDYLIRLSNLHHADGTILRRSKVSIQFK